MPRRPRQRSRSLLRRHSPNRRSPSRHRRSPNRRSPNRRSPNRRSPSRRRSPNRRSPSRRSSAPSRRHSPPTAMKEFWIGLSESDFFVVIREHGSYDIIPTRGKYTRRKQQAIQRKIRGFEEDENVRAVLLGGGRANEFFEIFSEGGASVPEILLNWKRVFRHHVDGKQYTL